MRLFQGVNWFAVAAVLLGAAMFVVLMSSMLPDAYAEPLGLAAVVSAVLGLYDRVG